MAEAVRYVCSGCFHAIEAWSDGNPYYTDESGVKQYAYHPDHDNLARCIGNDSPYLCLACGAAFMVDSRKSTTVCPKCNGAKIKNTYELDGAQCPYCNKGVFAIDPGFNCIS